jgi:hypothetical protein
MAKIDPDGLIKLDLNNPVFQENLLTIASDHDSTYGKK